MRRPPQRGTRIEQFQAEALNMLVPPHILGRTVAALTAPLQVPDQTAAYEPVNLPPGGTRIPVTEVVGPPSQLPIQAGDQVRDRSVALIDGGQLSQPLPLPC